MKFTTVKRRLSRAGTWILILLAIGLALIWAWSEIIPLGWMASQAHVDAPWSVDTQIYLTSRKGILELRVYADRWQKSAGELAVDARRIGTAHWTIEPQYPPDPILPLLPRTQHPTWLNKLGLLVTHDRWKNSIDWWLFVQLRYWFMESVILGVLVIVMIRRWRRGKRKPGFCPVCGYDLRATPQQCRECGIFLLEDTRKGKR